MCNHVSSGIASVYMYLSGNQAKSGLFEGVYFIQVMYRLWIFIIADSEDCCVAGIGKYSDYFPENRATTLSRTLKFYNN